MANRHVQNGCGAGRGLPVLFQNREDCCGCGACCAKCPRDAISMREDAEGFYYPSVDAEKCVGCGQCEAVCPVKHAQPQAIEAN